VTMRIAMLLQRTVEHDSRVRREAAALAEAGHDVILLEHDPTGPGIPGVVRRPVLRGAAWRRVPRRVRLAALTGAFAVAAVRERPDAVHAHDVAMLPSGLVAARLARARLVYDSHELASGVLYRGPLLARVAAAIERVAIPRCDALVTVSDAIAERLAARHPRGPRPVVLRNVCGLPRPLEGAPPAGLRDRLGLDEQVPLVLFQGAAAPGRGGESAIEALTAAPGAHLVFLGDPEPGFGGELAALADRAGVADRVHFLPSVPLDRLLEHTREADVGLILYDGTSENLALTLPNKLFELLAAGVPALVAAGSETGRVVREHGVGWTVDASDAAAVTAGLQRALAECRDPALLARVRAADAAFDWQHERERLLAVFATPRPALLVVRNAFTHDARVLRAGRLLAEMGYAPRVVALRTDAALPRSERIDGIPVVRIDHDARWARPLRGPGAGAGTAAGSGAPSPAMRAYRALRSARFTLHALRVVLRERPALVHCNDFNTMWVGVLAKLLAGSRVIYDSHELWADRNGRWEWRPGLIAAEALFVRIADRVVTVSPGIARAMAARYRIPLPAVVLNVPAGQPNGTRVPSAEPVAVYVGQLRLGRGLEQAVDALALVPELRLRIIGPDFQDMAAQIRRRAEAAGVADRVELPGGVGPDAVVEALAGAAIGLNLIQPVCRSYELTLPNKLHEYVTAGVPVLSSDVEASAAYVSERGVGDVVPAADVEAIARGMRRLLAPGRAGELRPRLEAAARELRWELERERLRAAYAAALR
jgi:glycosyltransferase involved in cell wall biosynthesis